MELMTVYIWGTIGALFCLIVGGLIGHVWREKQCEHTLSYMCKTHTEWRMAHEDKALAELSVMRERAEFADATAEKMASQWEYADKFRAALVELLCINYLWDFDKHGDDPEKMLAVLIAAEKAEAVDPAVSKAAKNLHTRGVRKGAKMGRLQMHKLMQKSIDNQAQVIQTHVDYAQAQTKVITEQRDAFDIYRAAVANTIEDKIALPGVRKSFKQALRVELDRMKSVAKFLES